MARADAQSGRTRILRQRHRRRGGGIGRRGGDAGLATVGTVLAVALAARRPVSPASRRPTGRAARRGARRGDTDRVVVAVGGAGCSLAIAVGRGGPRRRTGRRPARRPWWSRSPGRAPTSVSDESSAGDRAGAPRRHRARRGVCTPGSRPHAAIDARSAVRRTGRCARGSTRSASRCAGAARWPTRSPSSSPRSVRRARRAGGRDRRRRP